MAGSPPINTVYPFAEIFQASTSGTTAVDVWDIPAGTIISMVMLKIKTAGTGTGNVSCGDDDDADGYILAADATAAADTVYGDGYNERGVYLCANGVTGTQAPQWKFYTSTGTEVKIVASAALTTEATVDIFIFGYRYHES